MTKKLDSLKPIKELMKKIYQDGVCYTIFLAVYIDKLNWCLHEDAPWKDTIKIEVNQSCENYKIAGIPKFVLDLLIDDDYSEFKKVINEVYNEPRLA
jgi:hypothetical protein